MAVRMFQPSSSNMLNSGAIFVEVVEASNLTVGGGLLLSLHETSDYPIVHAIVTVTGEGFIFTKLFFRFSHWNVVGDGYVLR